MYILFPEELNLLWSDDDVVDGDVDELDEETDEAHDAEPDGGGDGNLRELLPAKKKPQLTKCYNYN